MHLGELSKILNMQKLSSSSANSHEFKRLKKLEHQFPHVSDDRKRSTRSCRPSTPRGYLPVYVGDEGKRYLIKAKHLNNPVILELLERWADEYGYSQSGALRLQCDAEIFESIILASGASTYSGRSARVLSCRA